MGYKTKVQLIKRKESEQWYINFPAAMAQAMDFQKAEEVEWEIESKTKLVLLRKQYKKTRK
jgi:antitoxin component of MazEF toxin-antitoxin module